MPFVFCFLIYPLFFVLFFIILFVLSSFCYPLFSFNYPLSSFYYPLLLCSLSDQWRKRAAERQRRVAQTSSQRSLIKVQRSTANSEKPAQLASQKKKNIILLSLSLFSSSFINLLNLFSREEKNKIGRKKEYQVWNG